jgi:hypothetical protein
MAISVNHIMVGTDRGVPVGSEAGAADDDDAVTTVVVDASLLGALLLVVPMRARSWVMTELINVIRSSEPEAAAGVLVYKIQSGKPFSCKDTRRHSPPHPCTPACCRFDA